MCVPSRNEPFGIVVLEAWDAKKPVVASNTVTLVENFRTGIIANKEPSSIAWGLNYVLEGLGRNRMGEKVYDLLKKRYNWKIIAPAVTISEPRSKGNNPNCSFTDVGYQNFPVRKSRRDVSLKRSKLSLNKKRQIRKRIMTVRALTENRTDSIDFSLYFLLNIFFLAIALKCYFFSGMYPTSLTMLCPFSLNTKLMNSCDKPVGSPLV